MLDVELSSTGLLDRLRFLTKGANYMPKDLCEKYFFNPAIDNTEVETCTTFQVLIFNSIKIKLT